MSCGTLRGLYQSPPDPAQPYGACTSMNYESTRRLADLRAAVLIHVAHVVDRLLLLVGGWSGRC